MTPVRRHLPAVLLLAAYALLAATSIRNKSTTFDELVHLTSGYSYWTKNDYRLNSEAGNFPQRWAALPLLLDDLSFPSSSSLAWRHGDLWKVGYAFFYEEGNDPDQMLLQGRLMILVLGCVSGVLVYRWAGALGGRAAGTIALGLFAFSPTMLAHGRLVTSEMAVALTFAGFIYFFWAVLHRVTVVGVLCSAGMAGLLFLSKMSAPLAVPLAVILAAARLWIGPDVLIGDHPIRDRWQRAGVLYALLVAHALLVLLMIWAAFGFRYATSPAEAEQEGISGDRTISSLSRTIPLGSAVRLAAEGELLPQAYLYGFCRICKGAESRSAFLNSEYSVYGWAQFFPVALLIKTPFPTLAAFTSAGVFVLVALLKGSTERRKQLYHFVPLLTFLGLYWAFAISSRLNIGQRYLVPVYPAQFILAGVALARCWRSSAAARAIIGAALAWLAVNSVVIWPHYLAYFNEFVGGPRNGYRHLVDSSLDWGQDLPGLKKWLDRHVRNHGELPVYLSYFGTASPGHYGIRAQQLPGYMQLDPASDRPEWTGGIYCISATMLQSVYSPARGPWTQEYETEYQNLRERVEDLDRDRSSPVAQFADERLTWYRLARLCAYLRQREPDQMVGYSILIYRLSDADVQRAMYGPAPLENRDLIRE